MLYLIEQIRGSAVSDFIGVIVDQVYSCKRQFTATF